jgi:hypothetical protein
MRVVALLAMIATAVLGPAVRAAHVPTFQVDAAWPQTLPNNWILGQVAGVAVDPADHVWII